ncbi:MAG: hypothetical protein RIB86_12790 [Imperialibacter sp.]
MKTHAGLELACARGFDKQGARRKFEDGRLGVGTAGMASGQGAVSRRVGNRRS